MCTVKSDLLTPTQVSRPLYFPLTHRADAVHPSGTWTPPGRDPGTPPASVKLQRHPWMTPWLQPVRFLTSHLWFSTQVSTMYSHVYLNLFEKCEWLLMWIKAAPAREAQGDLAYMPNYTTQWTFFMVWIRTAPGREAWGILTCMPIYMARFVSKVIWPHNNQTPSALKSFNDFLHHLFFSPVKISHVPMPYKISPNPQLRAAAGALTAHGSCPHAIPHYSLNKRALLPDLESLRNLSFDSSAHRSRISLQWSLKVQHC